MSGSRRPFRPNVPTVLGVAKSPTSAKATFDPMQFIKQNGKKNTYDIYHVKKLIGKKIMMLDKGVLVGEAIKQDAKVLKEQLLIGGSKKNIIIHAITFEGTLRVIGGIVCYAAICLISYQEIKSNSALNELELKVIQYPKPSQVNIKRLIDYLK